MLTGLLAFGLLITQTTATAAQDWPLYGRDVGRSSAAPTTGGFTASSVQNLQRHQITIDGTVDASAIYLHAAQIGGASHETIFVTTSYGKTIAIDAVSGTILWEHTPTTYAGLAGSYRITNTTPAADSSRQYIYTASPDGRVYKLAVADGHEIWSAPITHLPARERVASPLTVFHGKVIVAVGGYLGDQPPYQGHVVILDGRTGHLLHVWNALCSPRRELLLAQFPCQSQRASIWGRAGAVIDSSTGGIFVATGNGPFNGRSNWGDATIELDSTASMIGNWAPANQAYLDSADLDLGSSSPVLMGPMLVAQGGKDGRIHLIDWRRMRGTTPHVGRDIQIVTTPDSTDLRSAPAVMHDITTTWLFVADNLGTQAWKLSGSRLTSVWKNSKPGTSPVVAGGLLFVYDAAGYVRVYDAATGHDEADLSCGAGHWNSPIVVDGMIIEPEGDANHKDTTGVIDIWR